MIRNVLAALVVVGLALLAVPAASAHPAGNWYWTRAFAENYILTKVTTSDGEDIVDVVCTGLGTPWRTGGRVLWHRFRCDENDDVEREFTVILQPVSRYHAIVTEINCDDSFSDYTCP